MNEDFKRLTFIDSIWWFIYYLIAPFLSIYFNNLGGLDDVGISVGLLLIMQGLVSIISAKFVKIKSMKKIFLVGQVFEGLRILLFVFASSCV